MKEDYKVSSRVPEPVSETIHLLIRFSDSLFNVGDVIGAHRAVLSEEGEVWVGKFGKPLGLSRRKRFLRARELGEGPKLFLANRRDKRWRIFSGAIADIRFDLDSTNDPRLPSYYEEKQLLGLVGFWILLQGLNDAKASVLDELTLPSSGSSARFALEKSMNGFFIVH